MAVLKPTHFSDFLDILSGSAASITDAKGTFDAASLLEQMSTLLSLKPQRILLSAAPSADFVSTLLGLLSQGHLVIPCPPDLPQAALQKLAHTYQAAPWGEGTGDSWTGGGTLGLLTSGSTGDSKVVLMQAPQVGFNISAVIKASDFKAPGPTGLFLPLHHSFGLITQLLPALLQGAPCFLAEKLRFPADISHFIKAHKIQTFAGVPTLFKVLEMGCTETFDLVQHITVAGAALEPAFAQELTSRFPNAKIWAGYGLTEAGPRVTTFSNSDKAWGKGSVGRSIPGVTLKIEDSEICVQSPSSMLGYLDQPEATVLALSDGWLRTGDLGRINQEGYVFIEGRKDDFFQSGGEKIAPLAIEKCLNEHPNIHQAAIFAVPDPFLGHKIRAYLELLAPVKSRELRSFCKTQLASGWVPHEYHKVTDLPQTSNGKIKRKALNTWPSEKIS